MGTTCIFRFVINMFFLPNLQLKLATAPDELWEKWHKFVTGVYDHGVIPGLVPLEKGTPCLRKHLIPFTYNDYR